MIVGALAMLAQDPPVPGTRGTAAAGVGHVLAAATARAAGAAAGCAETTLGPAGAREVACAAAACGM